MSLADHPTLDVVTLRAVACELRSGLLDQVSALADAARATARSSIGRRLDDASLDALAQVQDIAREVSEAIAAIGREATRREESAPTEARPPLLSDWVRACEGTDLGDPVVAILDGRWGVSFGPHNVVLGEQGEDSAVVYPDGDAERAVWCSTPAELRAALDRLAAEVTP